MLNKKVLIVVFSFPPSPSIGGRRWSYFIKYLMKNNFEINVICSDFIEDNQPCPWNIDLSSIKERIHYLPHKTPYHIFNKSPKNLFGKIRYRISLFLTKIKRPYNFYDKDTFYAQDAFKLAKQIIKENDISNVIVTGGPFLLVHEIAQLKQIFKDKIKLFVDLRDPWTEKFDIDSIQNNSLLAERKRHKEALEWADITYVPYEKMRDNTLNIFPEIKDKVKILPHGFDEDLFSHVNDNSSNEKQLSMFYAGAVYDNMSKEYDLLNQLIYKGQIPTFFYCTRILEDYELLKNKLVSVNGILTQQQLFSKMKNVGIALFLTWDKDFKTSKFMELIRSGKFILYIGLPGEIANFIESNKLGFFINSERISTISEKIFHDFINTFNTFVPNYELAQKFTFENLTQIIIEDLK